MKIPSLNRTLVALLCVQALLAFFLWTRASDKSATVMVPLIPDWKAGEITKIRVESGGENIELAKIDDGWVVSNYFDFPAKQDAVSDALNTLSGVRAGAPMTNNPSRHGQLGVGGVEFNTKVTLIADEKTQTLWIGNAAGGRRTSMRIDEDPEVYAAEGIQTTDWSSDIGRWVETKLFEGSREAVQSFSLKNQADESFSFFRNEEGGWTASKEGRELWPPKGKKLDNAALDSLLSTVLNIRLSKPADPEMDIQPKSTMEINFSLEPQEEGPGDAGVLTSPAAEAISFGVGDAVEGQRVVIRDLLAPVWVKEGLLESLIDFSAEKLWIDPAAEAPPANLGMPEGLPPGITLPPGMQMP